MVHIYTNTALSFIINIISQIKKNWVELYSDFQANACNVHVTTHDAYRTAHLAALSSNQTLIKASSADADTDNNFLTMR